MGVESNNLFRLENMVIQVQTNVVLFFEDKSTSSEAMAQKSKEIKQSLQKSKLSTSTFLNKLKKEIKMIWGYWFKISHIEYSLSSNLLAYNLQCLCKTPTQKKSLAQFLGLVVKDLDNSKKIEKAIKSTIKGSLSRHWQAEIKETKSIYLIIQAYKLKEIILKSKSKEKSQKLRTGRPSPAQSATLFKAGVRKKGQDGLLYQVIKASNGSHRWQKIRK